MHEAHTSPTFLYLLKLSPITLNLSDASQAVLKLAFELGISKFDRAFFKEVKSVADRLLPLADAFFAVDYSKKGAITRFKAELDSRRAATKDPYAYLGAAMPFCFQCLRPKQDGDEKPFSGSLFFIFSAPENGLRLAVNILRSGGYAFNGKFHEFSQIYEHRLDDGFFTDKPDNRLSYIILDWEVLQSKVAGRLTHEQLSELREEFPRYFCKGLHDKNLVAPGTPITGERVVFCVNFARRALMIFPPQ